jgi:aryl-alcohol dehydrogenase-like predicted oxidoreductase
MNQKLILGTAQFGLEYGINNRQGQISEVELNNILKLADRSGVRVLDTADSYGNAIERIGRFHLYSGKQFIINTKFRIDTLKSITDQLTTSIDKLVVKSIDTCFYHSYFDYLNNPKVMKELKALKDKGVVKKIGVSIYHNDEIATCIDDNYIDVIQIPFNLLDNNNLRGYYIKLAKLRGKEIHVRSVFLQGLFFMNKSEMPHKLLPLLPYLETLWKIAYDLRIDIGKLALAYVKRNPFIDRIIIGVDSEKHLAENFLDITSEIDDTTYRLIDSITVSEISLLNPQNWR